MSKRKYHVGHLVPERSFFTSSIRINFIRWIFGMYDVNQKLGVLEFVNDRTQGTLFPIIKKYIRGGTIIHSDSAAMYVKNAQQQSHLINIPTIPMPPYQHAWVNHTQHFVIHSRGRAQTTWRVFGKMLTRKTRRCVEPQQNYSLLTSMRYNGVKCMERKQWRLLIIF